MAAGLGFKTFTTGEVLTAADTNGYLMQGILVFASAAARDAAITSPQEGQFAYLKDTNVTTYYTGSAWANVDTTGMTNPMTTTGDTIYSSSGSTPARLGIGSTGQVLTVAGGIPSWATPAGGGGMTLIETLTLSGASVTSSSIAGTYKDLYIVIQNAKPAGDNEDLKMRFNGDSGANRYAEIAALSGTNATFNQTQNTIGASRDNSTNETLDVVYIPSYANTTTWKICQVYSIVNNATTTTNFNYLNGWMGAYNQTGAITTITIRFGSGNITSGTALIYGVN
jgi:hypothetical protein